MSSGAVPQGAPAESKAALRRVYRYSIVPGGVASQAELAQVIRTDRVVAAHYATFDVDKARAVTVTTPRAVHVSYRKGDKVYWTAKKVMLVQGETLFSDGVNEMRARCANRISDVPRLPVETHGPDPKLLDASIQPDQGSLEFASADGAAPLVDESTWMPLQPQFSLEERGGSETASISRSIPADNFPYPVFGGDEIGSMTVLPPRARANPNPLRERAPVAVEPLAPGGGALSGPPLAVFVEPPPPVKLDPGAFIPPGSPPTNPPLTGDEELEPAHVPEPGTAWLMATTLMGMLSLRRIRRRRR